MVEAGAAAAGSAAGAAAGKQVSRGIDSIFRKVDATARKAASVPEPAPAEPAIQVGDGVPRTYSVPPPPPIKGERRVVRRARAPEPIPPPVLIVPAEPPRPPVTADVLATVQPGMSRDEVQKLGAAGIRITMYDDGHLVELLRYPGGAVRLSDGLVQSVQIR